MEIMQVVTEAAKGSSKVVLDAPMIGLIITNGVLIWRDYMRTRKAKKNGNGPMPGKAEECLKHRDELTTLKTEQKNTKEDIAEIKGDVKELLKRVPSKE